MAISVISKSNANNIDNTSSDISDDFPYKEYPNYVRLVYFVNDATESVVKTLLASLVDNNVTGKYVTTAEKHGNDWKSYYNNSTALTTALKDGDNTKAPPGPYVLLDGFNDQPINFSSYLNWESNGIEAAASKLLGITGTALSNVGNILAATRGGAMRKGLAAVTLAGGTVANVGSNSNQSDTAGKVAGMFLTGSTGWPTIKTPSGGNHMVLNLSLRKYDLCGDGAPLELANLMTVFCSPIRGIGERLADMLNEFGEAKEPAKESNDTTAKDGTGSFGDMVGSMKTLIPKLVWSKFLVGLVTNYKKVGAMTESVVSTETAETTGALDNNQSQAAKFFASAKEAATKVKDQKKKSLSDDNIVLFPMIITNFSYTPSENMILLKNGNVGPAYVDYQVSLSSLTIMSNIDIADLIVSDSILNGTSSALNLNNKVSEELSDLEIGKIVNPQ